MSETLTFKGRYDFECRDSTGNLKWAEVINNVVCTVGKNLSLDTILAGSAYTVVGPFMGLISGASFTAVAAGDSMASHTGWLEGGNANAPTYSGTRQTCVWSAASAGSKALSAGLTFTFTGAGTVQGAFLVFGSGAVNTIDSTAGTILSAGTFASPKTVASTDTLTINYTLSV
jgi:hypothetical protein